MVIIKEVYKLMVKNLKIVELFAGIGSQYKALKNIGINTEVVAISEWDIPCLISYDAVHNKKEECSLSKEENLNKSKLLQHLIETYLKKINKK